MSAGEAAKAAKAAKAAAAKAAADAKAAAGAQAAADAELTWRRRHVAVAHAFGTSVEMFNSVYDSMRRQRLAAQGAEIMLQLLPLPDAAVAEDEESDADTEVVAQGALAATADAGTLIPLGVPIHAPPLALGASPAPPSAARAVTVLRPAVHAGRLAIPAGTDAQQRDALMRAVRAREEGALVISHLLNCCHLSR